MHSQYTGHRSQVFNSRRRAYYASAISKRATAIVRKARDVARKTKPAIMQQHKARFSLQEPKQVIKELYIKNTRQNATSNASLKKSLVKAFKKCRKELASKVKPRKLPGAVISIAVRRLANKALSTCKQCAGLSLVSVRSIKELKLSEDNLGLQFHTAWSEPYFYDQSYNAVVHDGPLYIDSNGRCALAQEIAPTGENGKAKKWKCTDECKLLTPEEIKSIVELKAMFQLSIPNIRRSLDDVHGGCSYTHHSRPIIPKEKEKIGASSNTSNDVVVNKDNEVANSKCNNDVTSEKNCKQQH